MTPEERFWSRVDQAGDHECWPWTGPPTDKGYGQFGYHGKNVKAHRLAWRLGNGPIPQSKHVRQTCRNKLCCNYRTHMVLITASQKSKISVADGNNREARKTHCPRGHLLQSPNLVTAQLATGKRKCLACHRTKDVSLVPLAQQQADHRYELIMLKGVDNGVRTQTHSERGAFPVPHRTQHP